jgi:methylglutaconyl-CoA hydratase
MSGVRVERDGTFARVTLARPEVRNAFNAALIAELTTIFNGFAREPADALRGVVLAGDGPVFCAGADVEWMREAADLTVEENERDASAMQAMFTAIDLCPAPVLARVHGAALGGGMGLCAVADSVIATADATFGFTEVRLGILPAVISTFVLPRIGESHARALFTSGERFGAERAMRIGLVHEVADDVAGLDAAVSAWMEAMTAAGPTAARAAKSLVRELRTLPPDEARRHTARHIAQQRVSPEGQAGLAAFLDRRRPPWSEGGN